MMENDVLHKTITGVILVVSGMALGFLIGANYIFLKMI